MKTSQGLDRDVPDGVTGLLQRAAPICLAVGAVGAVGLTLFAGRDSPPLLMVMFIPWVMSPFVVGYVANLASKRWSVYTRAALHGVLLLIALGTPAIYAAVAMAAPGTRSAFPFVMTPPASWLLIGVAVSTAALLSRGRARQVTVPDSPGQELAGRVVRVFVVLAIAGVLGIAALWVSLWLEHRSAITLPTPTGRFAVGRTIQDWTDDASVDSLAPVAGTKRELLVWIWYPAAAGSSATDDYVPAGLRPKDAGGPSIWRLLTRDHAKVRTNSILGAAVSPQQPSYPVVIMRAGASAPVVNYSTLAQDLASHGYVVVGFDAPYRTSLVVFPDGRMMGRTPENNPELCLRQVQQASCADRLISAWNSDIAFVLDRLAQVNTADSTGRFRGRLDLTRVGVFGHSFGGATAAQFCHHDSRCRAGIDVDGAPHGSVIQAGLRQPFMFLMSDHGAAAHPASRQIVADIQSIYDRQPADRRFLVMIHGSHHLTFSDDGALLKSRIVRGVLRLFGKLGISGRRQLTVTVHVVHTFFDAYLKDMSRPAIASPFYREIEILQRISPLG